MSSLLKDAIVDAKALRESALKNAETSIIEKYSDEVKQTLDQLLEQDELAADTGATNEDVAENIPSQQPITFLKKKATFQRL